MDSRRRVPVLSRAAFVAAALVPALIGVAAREALAQEPARPITAYLTVESPVDENVRTRITNATLQLKQQATQEGRKALLVLEIPSGNSPMTEVQELVKFLVSSNVAPVTTVAWVPDREVTGSNALVALACNEILMHPDGVLGDVGRGQAIEKAEQDYVLSLLGKRQNVKVSPALVRGMMDPAVEVVKVEVQPGGANDPTTETQIITREEQKRKAEAGELLRNPVTIKDPGTIGRFSGSEARARDFLVTNTATSRIDIETLYRLPPGSLKENPAAGGDPNVRLIKVDGPIDSVLQSFIERQIQRAVGAGANTIVFEINSPGGELTASLALSNAIADLEEKNVRTVAYVPKKATALSGAAIISLGADEIYMHPTAALGDAGVIQQGRDGLFDRAPEKIVSFVVGEMKTIAERKRRPPALLMAMVDRNLDVYRVRERESGRIWYMSETELHAAGDEWEKLGLVEESRDELLLTVNGTAAAEYGIAESTVRDFDELKERLGIPAGMTVPVLERTWVDDLIAELNTQRAMYILAVVGFVCLFLELHLMTGLLGIIAALCFALFFWGHFMGGTAGWLEVILFILGVACLGLEIFVIPGFGVFGISGGLMLLASIVLASQTWGSVDPNQDLQQLVDSLKTLSLAVVSVVIIAVLMNRFLPQIPLLNAMILSPPGLDEVEGGGPRLRPELSGMGASGPGRPALGTRGTTLTALRPAGKAQVGDEMLDVVSDGTYIPANTPVEVAEISMNRIVVRQV